MIQGLSWISLINLCPMEIPFEKRMKFLESEVMDSEEHLELQQRLRKTLYYGKMKNMEYQSLAMTELAVEYLQELVPRELGRIDMYWASSISRDVTVTPCALMLALIYLKRLKHNNAQYLSQVSSSDLFLISVLVASKYLYDEGESDDVSNIQWACQTKTDVEDINENERAFLDAINWNVFVKPEDFWSFLQNMEEKVAWKMSIKRNSFTYTDMSVLVSSGSLYRILYEALSEICKTITVLLAAYVGCVLTLCASNVIPAIVFSHALVPISSSSQVDTVTVVPNLPSPAKFFRPVVCVPAVERAPKRSLHRLMNNNFNVNFISSPDIPAICKPWGLLWSPGVCFHASACVTVALIQELATYSYAAALRFNSLIARVGQNIQQHSFGTQNYDVYSPGQLRNSSSNSASNHVDSSARAAKPSGGCGGSVEAKKVERSPQNLLRCSDIFGSWSRSAVFVRETLTLRNYSMALSSMSPSLSLVQVFGY